MTKEKIFETSDLNKEENKKYICHEAREVAVYLQTDNFAPVYCLLERAYICGRKTSEKQIDELVSENDKLEKENADLKEQNRKLLESCEGATMMYEHLTKAKVALRKVVDCLGQFCSDYPDCVIDAEQFLKEIE